MLTIHNKEKLVGNNVIVGGDIWEIIGVYEYPAQYQIHLKTGDSALADKVFILIREENFAIGNANYNANYKIMDRYDPMSSVWVNRANISNIPSMIRTLKRILSHANNP
jgi:hypothetical protein